MPDENRQQIYDAVFDAYLLFDWKREHYANALEQQKALVKYLVDVVLDTKN